MQTARVLAFLSIKPFPLVFKLNHLCCKYLNLENRLFPSPPYFLLHTKLHCFLLYFSFYPENIHFFTILMILIVCLSAFSKHTCHELPNLVAQYRQGCCSSESPGPASSKVAHVSLNRRTHNAYIHTYTAGHTDT